MIPAPHPHEETIGTERDKLVEDMLSPEFWKLWAETGMRNRSAFEKVFRPVRSPRVVSEGCTLKLDSDRSLTTRSGRGRTIMHSSSPALAFW